MAVVDVAAGAAVVRLIMHRLYGVQLPDGAGAVATVLLVFAGALAASWLSARRAVRIDPISALRTE